MPNESSPPVSALHLLRHSLDARLRRMLARPLIASVHQPQAQKPIVTGPPALLALAAAFEPEHSQASAPAHSDDAKAVGFRIPISIDYEGNWRDCVKEVNDTLGNLVEDRVTLLTAAQHELLRADINAFMALNPQPESAEVVSIEWARIGGLQRATAIFATERPEGLSHTTHLAVVPNLVPIRRQMDALKQLETAQPHLAPLQALLGLGAAPDLPGRLPPTLPKRKLDEHQLQAVRLALSTPHFALIQGPPGSGKTTVIETIVAAAVANNERVLIVSPTHVAVDNVVEKLAAEPLGPHALPLRYAAKPQKLSPVAKAYWVSGKKNTRNATVVRRVREHLSAGVPFATALYKAADPEIACRPPVTLAHLAPARVICGTPLGIISCDEVGKCDTLFDLLIVDEVSKLTIPEFLAIAVRARRWILVGDPNQLPPYTNAEEHAVSLDGLYPPEVELACSIAAYIEQTPPPRREHLRLVAVCPDPLRMLPLVRAQIRGLEAPRIVVGAEPPGIVLCTPDELLSLPVRHSYDRSHTAANPVPLLVSTGLRVGCPDGFAFVPERERAQARLFSVAMDTYHSYPWALRTGRGLPSLGRRKGLPYIFPSAALLAAVGLPATRALQITAQLAYNAVAIYDWLGGIPTEFDTPPLDRLGALTEPTDAVRDAVAPFATVLRKQYRAHPSLTTVPRAFFYDGAAMLDGRPGDGCRVMLRQVSGAKEEENPLEAQAIQKHLTALKGVPGVGSVMVITPYRKQEALLNRMLEVPEGLTVDVCTLDRCQGREADYVLISLVRSRASAFMDSPKRWNVALTRAKEGLVIVGDIAAFAADARGKPSLLSQLIVAYRNLQEFQ